MITLKIDDRIRSRKVAFFNNVAVTLAFDSLASTFQFDYYFNPDNNEHKELACIGHYHLAKLEYNDELLLTGNVLSEKFKSSNVRQLIPLSGYSLPGVLEDCEIPPDVTLQSDGLTLQQIAKPILDKFGLKLVVDSAVQSAANEVFETSTAKRSDNVKAYLQRLAAQKNIILTHNAEGAVVFTRAKAKQTPIAEFEGNTGGVTSMEVNFNGQAMHSHITVVREADSSGGNAGESTVRNPYVINSVYRPRVIEQSSGTDVDTDKAARMARAAELKNLSLTITLSSWLLNGKIIRPNNIVSVVNPEVYLYKKSNWFIERVELKGNESSQTATLHCVLPEVYNDAEPKYLFTGINLH